ncbi:alpha/beta fold hydrolase [Romboutsia sp.]|uniref:alpha/beta fold hydrolase n=1 Tax=Romboutsia sp. TaxID=1965302 RepID=UPI003F2C696D
MESNLQQESLVKVQEISVNGLIFKCRTAGLENNGDPIIFLHGFPESSHMWIGFMNELAQMGYRCLAPDQRGYSPKARPKGKEKYTLPQLASDIVALADEVGFKKFHLIGHDWGSMIGWAVVELYKDRIQSWSALAVPHVGAYTYAAAFDPEQNVKSQYVRDWLTPDIPEMIMAQDNFKMMRDAYATMEPDEAEDYLTIFRELEARTATLNYYRANQPTLKGELESMQFGDVTTPTLYIWGNKDVYIGRAGSELMKKQYMKGEYKFVELDCGHWMIQENYKQVTKPIIEHIISNSLSS